MRAENSQSKPVSDKYLRNTLVAMGVAAFAASVYVAWPALAHLGSKMI